MLNTYHAAAAQLVVRVIDTHLLETASGFKSFKGLAFWVRLPAAARLLKTTHPQTEPSRIIYILFPQSFLYRVNPAIQLLLNIQLLLHRVFLLD